uniref:Glycosylation-dependent cell adhesion molecule 1 n=1 Tax=Catagonus wagneri TaxID=51154 RepID=A0A8C3WK71_9CETA
MSQAWKKICIYLLNALLSLAGYSLPSSFSALTSSISLAPAAQFISSNHRVSKKDLSKKASTSRAKPVSGEDVGIRSARRSRNQNPQPSDPIPQEQSFRNSALQSEETTKFTPRADRTTTSEGKLAKLGHKMGKNLENTVKETEKYLKSLLFPHASEVLRP